MINSKEEFIDLYLAVRASDGYLTFIQKYPDDFFIWLKAGKYNDLFSFFHTLDDLDFNSAFEKYYNFGIGTIDLIHREATGEDIIRLYPEFCYLETEKILKRFDKSLCFQMQQLIYDMEKTKGLNDKLSHDNVKGIYQMTNPNGFYTLNLGDRLFVDGVVSDFDNGDYLVENALFSVVERFSNGMLSEINVSSFYKNDDYVDHVINQVLSFDRECFYDSDKSFLEVKEGKVYQYKMRY